MNKLINQSPFLRTSRDFPSDPDKLLQELGKSYIDTAAVVNERVIGIYPSTKQAVTGCSYFINGNKKQQSLRQTYPFTTKNPINHGISINQIERLLPSCQGAWTDGTNWYGLPFSTNVAIAGQVTFYVTATQIVFLTGAGAPVSFSKGTVTLEWLSNP